MPKELTTVTLHSIDGFRVKVIVSPGLRLKFKLAIWLIRFATFILGGKTDVEGEEE